LSYLLFSFVYNAIDIAITNPVVTLIEEALFAAAVALLAAEVAEFAAFVADVAASATFVVAVEAFPLAP
jgi:hypothetical protein